MKMKPLHFLAFAMIAGIFFSACSSNIFSGRHYNLNLVKVEKTQQKISKKNKLAEPEVPQNITASSEWVYVNTELKKVWSKPATEKNNDLPFNKNANHSEPKPKAIVQNKNTQLVKNQLNNPTHELEMDQNAIVSFISGLTSIGLIYLARSIGESVIFVSIGLGILAFITGVIAMNRIKNGKSKGYGFARVGMTIGLIYVAILAVIIIFVFTIH